MVMVVGEQERLRVYDSWRPDSVCTRNSHASDRGQIQIGRLISRRDELEPNLHANFAADRMLSTHYPLDSNDEFV